MNRGHEDAKPRVTFAKPEWTPEQMKFVIAARESLRRSILKERKRRPLMKDEDRKRLTLFLNECWCEGIEKIGDQGVFRCEKCKEAFHPLSAYRTFLTWPDLGACMEALVRKGKWFGFWTFTHRIFHTERQKESSRLIQDWDFDAWLIRPVNKEGEAHFCALVAEFLERKDGQKP